MGEHPGLGGSVEPALAGLVSGGICARGGLRAGRRDRAWRRLRGCRRLGRHRRRCRLSRHRRSRGLRGYRGHRRGCRLRAGGRIRRRKRLVPDVRFRWRNRPLQHRRACRNFCLFRDAAAEVLWTGRAIGNRSSHTKCHDPEGARCDPDVPLVHERCPSMRAGCFASDNTAPGT
jgi:hypothetical protein